MILSKGAIKELTLHLARIETANQTIEYLYNAQGQRTLKHITEGSDTQVTLYVYNLEGLLIAELGNTGETQVEYAYLNSQPLAQINAANAEVFYYHNDHLGTPQKLTNSQGAIVWEATYSPFGMATVNEDLDNDGNPITQNIRFPGQYFDQETGLHYNWFRYYDPEAGRYITSDPIGLAGGINTYVYVDNNPFNFYDPEGKAKRKCSKRVYAILRGAVIATCKTPTACNPSDNCNVIRFKIATKKLCIAAQQALSKACFPNDQTHKQRIQDQRNGIKICEKYKKQACEDC